MKIISLTLAMLATVSMVVTPVAPSYGAAAREQSVETRVSAASKAPGTRQARRAVAVQPADASTLPGPTLDKVLADLADGTAFTPTLDRLRQGLKDNSDPTIGPIATKAPRVNIRTAATRMPETPSVRQAVAVHAARGEAAILSKAQLDRLATTQPKLHAKLMTAYQANAVPALTATEKKLVDAMTASNLAAYKAGNAAASPLLLAAGGAAIGTGGWFVIGFIILVAIILFLEFINPGAVLRFIQALFLQGYYR